MRRLIVLLLLLLGVVGWGGMRAEGRTDKDACLTLQKFFELMPGAEKNSNRDGACYLMRWNGCRIIAVVCTYGSEHVPLIFINADSKEDATRKAWQIAEKIPCSRRVCLFEKREPWVAIICPCLSESQRYTANVLRLFTRFIGWQGKLLRAQTVYRPSPDGRSKMHSATIETVLDITESKCTRGEFRSVKGRLDDDEIKNFIDSQMSGVSSYMPELSGREKKALREKFPGYEILAYSTITNTCIVRKGKAYHAGSIDAVAEYIENAHSITEFEYPKEEIEKAVPETDEEFRKDNKALAEEQSTPGGDAEKDASSQESGGKVSFAVPRTDERAKNADAGHEAAEAPPKTVQEAIDNYIRFLNKL